MSSKNKEQGLKNLMIYDFSNNSFVINQTPVYIGSQVISATLLGESIIFSIKDKKIYRIQTNQEENEYSLLFSGSRISEISSEFTQIRTDSLNINTFYAYSNHKIYEFQIDEEESVKYHNINIKHDFDKYAISSKYIATQKFLEKKDISIINVISRQYEENILQLEVNLFSTIYVDNIFLYIFDSENQTVSIYTLEPPDKTPYRTITSVVQIIEGDQIGIQRSTMEIETMGFKPNSFAKKYLPIYSYINKEYLYTIEGSLYSKITPVKRRKLVIPLRLEENVYFDNINYFYFKRDSDNKILCSKELFDLSTQTDFYSQIMLQKDFFLVSSNKCIKLYNKKIGSSEYNCRDLKKEMNAPLYSLVSDLKNPFSFFGLTDKGICNHYHINQNSNFDLSAKPIRKDVIDFCSSRYFIVLLTYYGVIHVINRNDDTDKVLSRSQITIEKHEIIKIYNDDQFLYILYQKKSKNKPKMLYQYQINKLEEEPTNLGQISNIWRTSNSGSICIQQKNLIICDGHVRQTKKKNINQGIAFSRGTFCIWKDESLNPPKFLQLYSDKNVITFYNGYCCFLFSPKQESFVIKFNDDSNFYSKEISKLNLNQILNKTQNSEDNNGKVTGKISNALSATVIGNDTIVFSTPNQLKLIFISKSEPNYGCYSIDIDIPQKKLNNLMPHPSDMNSFFGLDEKVLYMYTLKDGYIDQDGQILANEVISYSVSKKHILIQFSNDSEVLTEDSSVFIYDLDKLVSEEITVDDYQYSIEDSACENDKNTVNYYIDDDYVYVFHHDNMVVSQETDTSNSYCTLYKLNTRGRLSEVTTYENVMSIFDTFQVIVVLSENRFVFRNNIYKYSCDTTKMQVDTLFAACMDEVVVWDTFIDDGKFSSKDPVIYKQPAELKALTSCWFTGKTALLFKRGRPNIHLNGKKHAIENCEMVRFVLMLDDDQYFYVANEHFIFTKSGSDEKTVKNVGLLASADTYRSDPIDTSRFFAHFKDRKQLLIIQLNRDFRSRLYYNDVVKYDVSQKYFVYINGQGEVKCLERGDGTPHKIEGSDIDDLLNNSFDHSEIESILPFVDNNCVYLLNIEKKYVKRFLINGKKGFEIPQIDNVVNIWSTDGVVIQTRVDDHYFIHVQNMKFKTEKKQRIYAAALHKNLICLWIQKGQKFNHYTADLNKFNSMLDSQSRIDQLLKDFKQKLDDIVAPIYNDMLTKKNAIEHRINRAGMKIAELSNTVQTKNNLAVSVTELSEMEDDRFFQFVNDRNFVKNYLVFSRTPSMFLLVLAKKIIHMMTNRENDCKQNFPFWISLLYSTLSIIPIDSVTKAASKPFLNGLKPKIPDYIDFVDELNIEPSLKRSLNKNLIHIDVILSSFSID